MSHVFIVQGDISKLECDAFAMPSLFVIPDNKFFNHPPHLVWISGYLEKKLSTTNHKNRIEDLHPEDKPSIAPTSSHLVKQIILNDPTYPSVFTININCALDEQIERIVLFLDIAENTIIKTNSKPLHNRSKYLFAVPVIGTGGGGNYMKTGIVVKQILEVLWSKVEKTNEYDVVLCCYDVQTLQLAQKYRYEHLDKAFPNYQKETLFFIPSRFDSVFSISKYLAENLANDKLVLFIGNDIINNSNIPTWNELLDYIANDVNINTQCESWIDMDIESKSEIIQFRCEKQGKLIGNLIKDKLKIYSNTLLHLLLAGLQCNEVVTTNYDQSFENAVKNQRLKEKMSVIPTNICRDSHKWLLKLHGCISKPSSIIVTRQDYLRYMESNAALAGIVQAKMLTSQLLFIGFSMEDENFHKIMDSVLKAKKDKHSTVGITIQPLHNKYTCELWDPSIECISMKDLSTKNTLSEAKRDIEIFIDLVFLHTTKYYSKYILDRRFKELLSNEEQILSNLLQKLKNEFDDNRISLQNYPCIMNMFKEYGIRTFTTYYSKQEKTTTFVTSKKDHLNYYLQQIKQ